LLGVTENSDNTLSATGVKDADRMLRDFWNGVNNKQVVSNNILSDRHAQIHELSGKKIIMIDVPRADRHSKPVFIKNNPFTGSYRRNGEGDYRCTEAEVKNMFRDNGDTSQDVLLLEQFDVTAFDMGSVARYRTRLANLKPNHVWNNIPQNEFLQKIGALGKDKETGTLQSTAAGLLMFGYDYEIVKEFPNYFLDWRTRWQRSIQHPFSLG
jgi:predicted HTH transcriptional regulator